MDMLKKDKEQKSFQDCIVLSGMLFQKHGFGMASGMVFLGLNCEIKI